MKIGLVIVFLTCAFTSCTTNRRPEIRIESDRIHGYIKAGEFGPIYDEASPQVKECYSSTTFAQKMESLVSNLRVTDSELNFRELKDETQMSDFVLQSSDDVFAEGIYSVGRQDNNMREYMVFRIENSKLKLFVYRVFDITEKQPDVRSTTIGCDRSN